MDVRFGDELLDAPGTVIMGAETKIGRERERLNFADAVRKRFAFLSDHGFTEVESLPTIVRYQKNDLEIDVYHGRQSFEIGFGIARQGSRYSLSELIRAADPAVAEKYRSDTATTPNGIAEALGRLQELVSRYGERALRGDVEYFSALESQRKSWAEGYALDVLEAQIRPKAEAAFREGDYRQAAELYEKIRARLSATELKKLALARERGGP
jgi:hypothetical protein